MYPSSRAVVAIPVRNEAEWIGRCLRSLACQTRPPHAVMLLLNNCTDGTASIARSCAQHMPYRLHIQSHNFAAPLAGAGHARRLAMQAAAAVAGPHGVLLTTDADTVVAGDWVERNL